MKLLKGKHKEVLEQLEKDTFTIEEAKNTLGSYLVKLNVFSSRYEVLDIATTLLIVLIIYGGTHSKVLNSTYGVFVNLGFSLLMTAVLLLRIDTGIRKNHLKEVIHTYERWIYKRENGTEIENSELTHEKGSIIMLIFHLISLIIIIVLSCYYLSNLLL